MRRKFEVVPKAARSLVGTNAARDSLAETRESGKVGMDLGMKCLIDCC